MSIVCRRTFVILLIVLDELVGFLATSLLLKEVRGSLLRTCLRWNRVVMRFTRLIRLNELIRWNLRSSLRMF